MIVFKKTRKLCKNKNKNNIIFKGFFLFLLTFHIAESRTIKIFFDQINIQLINRVFIIGTVVVSASYVLTSYSLFSDGLHDLFRMLFFDGFFFYEKSRVIFHILYQLPAYLLIKWTSLSSLTFLIKIFSFGLIWIHIISFIGCYWILPKNKKPWIFFPLFAFFIGPVNALSLFISVALSVCSYVWLTAFVIHYSDLSCKIHKALFLIVPLPLILSHELMSYMAWPLIVLCWSKIKAEKNLFNRSLILFIIVFLFVTSVIQTSMILWHSELYETHRFYRLMKSLFYLEFLLAYDFYRINFPLLISLITLSLSFVAFHRSAIAQKILKMGLFIVLLMSGFLIFNISLFQNGGADIRIYPPAIALPLNGLLWWLYEKKNLDIAHAPKAFFLSCLFCILTISFVKVYDTQGFYRHQQDVSYKIHKNKGVVIYDSQISNCFKNVKQAYMIYPLKWGMFELSLFYPKARSVQTVLFPSFALCVAENYKNKGIKEHLSNCKNIQKRYHSFFNEDFEQLKKIRFFDFSKLKYYIENNISDSKSCEL